ncbi:MAG: transcriptional repressor [Anaerolineales bacterium]|nr:transcriptional repressor [Anaerolineales bacterium]
MNYLEIFHKNGYRITNQRQVILDAICEADGHATLAEIYYRAKKLDGKIDRSTIYRVLDVLVELGIVNCSEDLNGNRVYELVKEQPHHHLVCKLCGEDTEIDNQVIEEFYQNLQTTYYYEVEMDHLIVFGVCPEC